MTMGGRLQILIIALTFITLGVLIEKIRTKKLLLQYSLSWLSVLLVLLIVALFPKVLDFLSALAGIAIPMNMVFFLGFCFCLLIIFELTQAVSKMSEQIKELTQKIALLEKKITEQERDNSNN